MYNLLVRRGTTVAFVIGFLISALVLFLNFKGAGDLLSDDFEALYLVKEFGTSVGIGTLLVIVSIFVILLGGIYGLIVNPKGALKFVIGAGVLGLLMLILFFVLKDNNTVEVSNLLEEYDIKGKVSQLINVGIVSTIALLVIAFVSVILAEIRNAFN